MTGGEVMLRIFVAFGCSFVVFHTVCALNKMTKHTDHFVFIATVIMACATFGEFCRAISGAVPSPAESLFVAGVVCSMYANRRNDPCSCAITCRSGIPSPTTLTESDNLTPLGGHHEPTARP